MENTLYRLVYCSRRIPGGEAAISAEVERILEASRRNNQAAGITGALLYSGGSFAQVLEGPLAAIENVFERIQRDPRHTEVTVIQSGIAPKREFPEWSMAFAGATSPRGLPAASVAFDAVSSHAFTAGEQILAMLKDLIVSEEEWILLDA